MRIDLLAACLLFFAALAVTPAVSQNASDPASRHPNPAITDISVAERAGNVEVEVTFSKLVHAEVSTIEHPDRLVLDFPGCELAHPGQHLKVDRGLVLGVRAAAFSIAPPVARVVIDLKARQDHEETYAGNKLVIKLKSSGDARASSLEIPGTKLAAESRPLPPTSERTAKKPSADALPPPSAPQLGAATGAPRAYALLDRARALTVSDLEPLEAKARAGDLESETTLALAYHAGTLLKIDDEAALRLLQQPATRGFVAAEEAMGIFCQLGFGMAPDKAQAISWYTKAAQHGSRDAATSLALMYSTGDGIPKDPAKAATWFRTAAEAGDATAQLNLGALYHRGEGVPQDDAQTVLWLTKAADQGLVPAQIELAMWELRPEHGRNVDAAIGWFKRAADSGNALAQAQLGDIFADKRFERQDYSQAVNWYRKAAEQGEREGQFGLGARYLLGQGVPQDFDEARRWLTPAANLGHPYAQFLLATMFEAGQGGPVDAASAAKYYELAANYGMGEAKYRLGLLLASDRGNADRLLSAYKWLVLAEDETKESATTAEELRKLLTPQQVAQAEREIDEWRSAHAPRQSSR